MLVSNINARFEWSEWSNTLVGANVQIRLFLSYNIHFSNHLSLHPLVLAGVYLV